MSKIAIIFDIRDLICPLLTYSPWQNLLKHLTFSNLIDNLIVMNLSNGILLPKLLLPTLKKKVLVIEKNFWNLRLNAENFWDHLNNLFKQWKVRTIFGNRMGSTECFFNLFLDTLPTAEILSGKNGRVCGFSMKSFKKISWKYGLAVLFSRQLLNGSQAFFFVLIF